jgi:hypothetical protein
LRLKLKAKERESILSESMPVIRKALAISDDEIRIIVEKSIEGGEINSTDGFAGWIHGRFLSNCVLIDETGYAQMCVDALKILATTAATDFGSSRQRDMGQLWADMTRGYLGEYAFSLFLQKSWQIKAKLGHEIGKLEKYLPSDIHEIAFPGQESRPPKINIGIKTAKWNGIWMDIPGDQFNHSDFHILVKVNAGRDHLFAFFKSISVFRDKILKHGESIGSISKEESVSLFERLPSLKPIPAYIAGFVVKDKDYQRLSYSGIKGRTNYKITGWNGYYAQSDLDEIKVKENVMGKVEFAGIGQFTAANRYIFNTGSLSWEKNEWERIIERL